MDSLPDFVRPCSLSFQVALQVFRKAGLRDPDRPRQRYFCEVVAVKAGDVGVIRCCQRVLRLHHFDVVRDSRAEPVARLPQRFRSERNRAFLHSDFLRG